MTQRLAPPTDNLSQRNTHPLFHRSLERARATGSGSDACRSSCGPAPYSGEKPTRLRHSLRSRPAGNTHQLLGRRVSLTQFAVPPLGVAVSCLTSVRVAIGRLVSRTVEAPWSLLKGEAVSCLARPLLDQAGPLRLLCTFWFAWCFSHLFSVR